MSLKIAIQPDEMVHPTGQHQSFSERWIDLACMRDVEVTAVDVFSPDAIAEISVCDAFMWRYPSSAGVRNYGMRLMYAIEIGLGIPCFPDLNSLWYYENKPAQCYFFEAAEVPSPDTHIFWTREDAERFCETATFPFVLKLAGGHQSLNVRLVHNQREAKFYLDELFNEGVISLGYLPGSGIRLLVRHLRGAVNVIEGHCPHGSYAEAELQYGYFYIQEFLPGNKFEISVIIIGNRAFVVRRFAHPGDFRTRGSTGRMDWDWQAIDENAIRLAYHTAIKLRTLTIAVDILYRGPEPLIVELTLNYASWVVEACPGHWVLDGDPKSGKLTWVDGAMRAEDAIFDDFVGALRRSACATDTARHVTKPYLPLATRGHRIPT